MADVTDKRRRCAGMLDLNVLLEVILLLVTVAAMRTLERVV